MKTETINIDPNELIKNFVKDFMEHIESENFLEKILYGQIHIEYILNSILENGVYIHSKLNLEKMTFFNKIKLAIALGLIDTDIESSLEKLGNIRNRIAHNMDAELDIKEEKDFINVVKQSQLKNRIKKEERKWPSPFSCCVYILWFYLFEQNLKVINQRKHLINTKKNIVTAEPEELKSNAPKSFLISLEKMINTTANSSLPKAVRKKIKEGVMRVESSIFIKKESACIDG